MNDFDKPMIMLATSPGPAGANSVLTHAKNSAPFFAANIQAAVSLPSFHSNFDVESKELLHTEIKTNLTQAANNMTQ